MYIKVMGMQRTGTTYFENLIKNNTNAINLNNRWGWKHGPHRTDINKWAKAHPKKALPTEKIKAVIMIKNPYTWFTSIKKWAHSSWRKPNITPKEVFKNYNHLYTSHKEFLEGDVADTIYDEAILVRYEDYLENAERELKRVCDAFGCKLRLPLNRPNTVACSPYKFTKDMRRYYINQKPKYGRGLILKVTDVVDWELMRFYGYKPIE